MHTVTINTKTDTRIFCVKTPAGVPGYVFELCAKSGQWRRVVTDVLTVDLISTPEQLREKVKQFLS